MEQGNSKLKKAVLWIIALIILVPLSFLVYDSVIASGEEKIEFYYMTAESKMKPFSMDIRGENREDTLMTALHTLKESPKTEGISPSVPEQVTFRSVALINNIVVIDVSEEYHQLKSTEEVIARSAIVWTLTSLDFVDGVEINVEGQPLRTNTGNKIGVMNRDNVVIDGAIAAQATEYAILTLYFANEEGTDLQSEERVIEVNTNQAREKTILEQLIAGPKEKGNRRTIPVETKIRDVTTTSDGICYVDLSQDFVSKHNGGRTEELLTVYSIVNSLCELDYVDKVQFLVGGQKLDEFKGDIEFKTPFTAISNLKALTEE